MRSLLVIVAIVAASCSTGDSAVPGIDGSPDLEAADARPTTPSTTTTSSTTVTSTTTSPTTTNSATTSTSTSPTTTTIAAATDVCASLRTDGYETRKLTMVSLAATDVAAVDAACPDALSHLWDAQTIEQRMTAFNASSAPLAATDLVCAGRDFSLSVTNNVDHPIGVHASMRLVAEGVDGPLGSTLQPLVIWSLAPGATAPLAGEYDVNRATDAALTCEVDITAFDATVSDADASLGDTMVAELAVDDPSQWLPFLVAQGAAIVGSGDPDLAAVVEDVRSTEYPSVVAATQAAVDEVPATGTISVCTASVDGPDDRHLSIVYFDQGAESSRLQHGLFRRGNDQQWRWLSSSVYFDSRAYWNCGTPSINL